MSALTQGRMVRRLQGNRLQFSGSNGLAIGQKAYPGGLACVETSTGTIKAGASSSALVPIGHFADLDVIDNSGGSAPVPVTVLLGREHNWQWYVNDTGTAVTATGLLKPCYILDDQTVTGASSGNSKAGIVWGVDSVKGVLVELEEVI